jgi:hypothetical protein
VVDLLCEGLQFSFQEKIHVLGQTVLVHVGRHACRFDAKSESFSTKQIPSGGGMIRNMVATSDRRLYLACSGVNKVAVVDRNK